MTRVVCLPARDEADEIVGMMLAQLLSKAATRHTLFHRHHHGDAGATEGG